MKKLLFLFLMASAPAVIFCGHHGQHHRHHHPKVETKNVNVQTYGKSHEVGASAVIVVKDKDVKRAVHNVKKETKRGLKKLKKAFKL